MGPRNRHEKEGKESRVDGISRVIYFCGRDLAVTLPEISLFRVLDLRPLKFW